MEIYTKEEIAKIKLAGRLVIESFNYITPKLRIDQSTEEVNTLVHNFIVEHGGIPAPLNYMGYPKSVCISINSEVCHGIPCSTTFFKEGDLVKVDISLSLNGWFADACRTFHLGKADHKNRRLSSIARKALMETIKIVKPGVYVGDLEASLGRILCKSGFFPVIELCGHGVGRELHMAPSIYNVGIPKTKEILKEGMVFTLEPMLNIGTSSVFTSRKDGWTVYTKDGSNSAQWEHTILVTKEGSEILT